MTQATTTTTTKQQHRRDVPGQAVTFKEDTDTTPYPLLPSKAFYLVKTKTEPTPEQRELGCDAFSYYSNKSNLMKTLLLKDDDVEVLHTAGITFQGPAAKRRKGASAQPIQDGDGGGVRHTRISYEVHPCLLFEDDDAFLKDFLGMLDEMRCVRISEEEEEELGEKVKGGASASADEQQTTTGEMTISTLLSLFLDDEDFYGDD